jgi:hypothetical protein
MKILSRNYIYFLSVYYKCGLDILLQLVLREFRIRAHDRIPKDSKRAIAAHVGTMMKVMSLCTTLERQKMERAAGKQITTMCFHRLGHTHCQP